MTAISEQVVRDCAQNPAISRTAGMLHQSLRPKRIYEVAPSAELRAALAADIITLKAHPQCADSYFGYFADLLHQRDAAEQVHGWVHILEGMHAADESFYAQMHKGSAFYWVAVSAFLARDYQRAIVYMDAAFGQDLRSDPANCLTRPAGLFVTLRDDAAAQWARPLVEHSVRVFEGAAAGVVAEGGPQLTIAEYRTRFIEPALRATDGRRSIMTALLSFVMEYHDSQLDLDLLTSESGSREPAYVHLFKGALVFESLLRMSSAGQAIIKANPKATLQHYLNSKTIWQPLGFQKQPTGLGAETMDKLIARIAAEKSKPFVGRAIRAAWGIRNATGHSLAWPTTLTAENHREFTLLLFGAIAQVILTLYP